MPLFPLKFRPGIDRRATAYSSTGTYYDCDRVRFHNGVAQPIGGWDEYVASAFTGSCRSLIAWANLASTRLVGVGTSKKYYIVIGGSVTDITPIRKTTNPLGSNPLATTSGSSIVTVTDTNHGAVAGDYVTLSGATDVGGITASTNINKEVVVVSTPSTSTWTFDAGANASSTTTGGGASVVAAYQVNVGTDSTVYGTGWGAGTYGRGTWGSSATLSTLSQRLRIWSHSNYGEDLIINPRGGMIYYWDATSPTSRAVELSTVAGASNTPVVAQQIMVTNQRHVVAFGTNPFGSSTQDRLQIRWSDVEDPFDWTPTDINEAGDIRLTKGSEFVTAVETKNEILVWTDSSLHSMQYTGANFIYGLTLIGTNTNIVGPLAVAAFGDIVMWMGYDHFYVYDGRLSKLESPVENYIFSDINGSQRDKFFATTNSSWGEVTFFYCSADSEEIDRYVSINVNDNVWYYGRIARTAWIDRGLLEYPLAAGTDGNLYYHEYGTTDGSVNPAVGLGEYLESAPLELDDGNNFLFINRILPDFSFEGSSIASPSVDLTLKGRNYPGSAHSSGQGGAVTRSVSVPVEQFTTVKNIRLRARSVILRVDGTTAGTYWRMGTNRVEGTRDGGKT